MRLASRIGLLCIALTPLGGCAAPLEAPSAYRDERYLCAPQDAAEFAALAETCKEDYSRGGSCFGVASLKGDIAGEPFVAESNLSSSYVPDETRPNSLPVMHARARSPYFAFYISMTNLHTEQVADSSPVCRSDVSLFGIEVRGASATHKIELASCEIEPLSDGFYVAFSGHYARGGAMDACLYLFPQQPLP